MLLCYFHPVNEEAHIATPNGGVIEYQKLDELVQNNAIVAKILNRSTVLLIESKTYVFSEFIADETVALTEWLKKNKGYVARL